MLRTIPGIALGRAPRTMRESIVYVEVGAAALAEQGRSRERGVPPEVISRSLAMREPIDLTDAYQVGLTVR